MPYATADEFIAQVGDVEARQLAPAAGNLVDHSKIDGAIADADGELDSYLATRFGVPLTPVPRILRVHAIALARASLSRSPTDQIKQAADRARSWARDAAKGLIGLGSTEPGEADPLPASSGGPSFEAAPSVFAEGIAGWGFR